MCVFQTRRVGHRTRSSEEDEAVESKRMKEGSEIAVESEKDVMEKEK